MTGDETVARRAVWWAGAMDVGSVARTAAWMVALLVGLRVALMVAPWGS